MIAILLRTAHIVQKGFYFHLCFLITHSSLVFLTTFANFPQLNAAAQPPNTSVYSSPYYQAWRDAAHHLDSNQSDRGAVLQFNNTIKAIALSLPFTKESLGTFRSNVHQMMKTTFPELAPSTLQIFDEKLRQVVSASSGHQMTHTHHLSAQPGQTQQPQQYVQPQFGQLSQQQQVQ
jgi:hypothetical protein